MAVVVRENPLLVLGAIAFAGGFLRARGPLLALTAVLALALGFVLAVGVGMSGDYYIRFVSSPFLDVHVMSVFIGAVVSPVLAVAVLLAERRWLVTRHRGTHRGEANSRVPSVRGD